MPGFHGYHIPSLASSHCSKLMESLSADELLDAGRRPRCLTLVRSRGGTVTCSGSHQWDGGWEVPPHPHTPRRSSGFLPAKLGWLCGLVWGGPGQG